MPSPGWKAYQIGAAWLKTTGPGGSEELVEYQVQMCDKRMHEMVVKAARSKGGSCVDGSLKVVITRRTPRSSK